MLKLIKLRKSQTLITVSMGKLLKHRKRQTFFTLDIEKALKTLNNTFFSGWRGKVHFSINFQTLSFVHTRKVDGLTKYFSIPNLIYSEMHASREKKSYIII